MAKKTRRRTARPTDPQDIAPGLNAQQLAFCQEYLANGFNGTQAYQKAYPRSSYQAAMTSAYTLLRKPEILAYLKPKMLGTWKARQMDGEEALARLALAVTVDPRVFLDAKGNLLPPKDWPDDAAQLIDSYEVERGKIRLVSKTVAMRTMLEQTGKLKTLPDSVDALTEAIKQDRLAHKETSE